MSKDYHTIGADESPTDYDDEVMSRRRKTRERSPKRARPRVGDVLRARARVLAKRGHSRCSPEGGPIRDDIWVPGAIPGEQLDVDVTHVGQHRTFGSIHAIREASLGRRTAPCPQHDSKPGSDCGGCPWMIADEATMADAKRAWLADLGIEVDEVVRDDRPLGYRWSSKRALGGRAGAVIVGSRATGSNAIASMRGCLVDHPDIAKVFDELESVASGIGIVPYDEETGEGDLRFAWAKTNGAGDVLLTLISGSHQSRAEELAHAVRRPTGVAWCVQSSSGNDMRGHDLRCLRGRDEIVIDDSGTRTSVGPLGFLQPNPPVAARAHRDLVEGPSRAPLVDGGLAFDLYAGAGRTTELLRKRHREVRACESYPESAAKLGVVAQTAEQFLASDRDRPELIVANPPRAGMGSAVCARLSMLAKEPGPPLDLRIMSCEPRALARDLERLCAEGDYRIVGARAYDTLPQTAHVEVVVWLVSQTDENDFRTI